MILITNDDGYNSLGIRELYSNASKTALGAYMVAPDRVRSASGMSITFMEPLRATPLDRYGIRGYSISGYPADTVFMAKNTLLKDSNIDLIASGINHGSNISLRSLYTSGTISAAMTGALIGIKGMAFSIALENSNDYNSADFEKAGIISRSIINEFVKNGFPKNVDVLNINFPSRINEKTTIDVVPMYVNAFIDSISENKDPNGIKYYWFGNKFSKSYEKNTDYYTVMYENNISVTPLSVNGHSINDFATTRKFFENVMDSLYSSEGFEKY